MNIKNSSTYFVDEVIYNYHIESASKVKDITKILLIKLRIEIIK